MIDFHSHIIPGVDDGSRSIDETFALIKEAKDAGFEGIISTSHYVEGYYESNAIERSKWIEGLKYGLKNLDIDIDLYLGNEVYFTDNVISLLEKKEITTVNETNYILFEFPMNEKPINIYDVIYNMMEYNLIPVLAHPERYDFVQKDPNLVLELVEKGVLMQANYGSIIGQYGERAQIIVRKLFENNLVHFLGSDVHRAESIYRKIPKAIDEIENLIGREKLYEITTKNPLKVLNNQKIDLGESYEIKLSFKEKRILK